jgi:UDP-N-acetylglucosamine 4,6-dehydratase
MTLKLFNNKSFTIFGGTGSFGEKMLRHLLKFKVKEIVIFSRDEKKQEDLRRSIKDKRVSYIIGDIRDKESVHRAVQKIDYVFQAAALKQVPSCEFFPLEAYKTNVLGTYNVIEESVKSGVKKIVVLSTDKAVYPINAMGISKAMMEKVAIAKAREMKIKNIKTEISITRYGNVMFSRGSLLPFLIKQIKNNQNLTITDPNMTRFMMSLDDSVNLVMEAFKNANNGDIYIQKSPGCNIVDIAKALLKILNKKNKIDIIGSRHGEKINEYLCSSEEMSKSLDKKKYFIIPADNRNINYDLHVKKNKIMKEMKAYSSDKTLQLNFNQIIKLIKKQSEFKKIIDKSLEKI